MKKKSEGNKIHSKKQSITLWKSALLIQSKKGWLYDFNSDHFTFI